MVISILKVYDLLKNNPNIDFTVNDIAVILDEDIRCVSTKVSKLVKQGYVNYYWVRIGVYVKRKKKIDRYHRDVRIIRFKQI